MLVPTGVVLVPLTRLVSSLESRQCNRIIVLYPYYEGPNHINIIRALIDSRFLNIKRLLISDSSLVSHCFVFFRYFVTSPVGVRWMSGVRVGSVQ